MSWPRTRSDVRSRFVIRRDRLIVAEHHRSLYCGDGSRNPGALRSGARFEDWLLAARDGA